MIARSGKEARYRSMNVKGKGCGAAATSSGCQCWVATIHQDTIKFSSSAVQIRAIIERFFLEPSVFILLDSTLENFFFPSKVAACRYHIGVKSCDDESLDSFINEMSAQLPKKGSVVGPPKVR